MLFSSVTFLLYFFPLVFILYYLFSFSRPIQNAILLVFSLLFYAWGEPVFVLVMIGSILFNYFCGLGVGSADRKKAKVVLVFNILGNLAVLFVFKYLNFTLDNLVDAGLVHFSIAKIALPIGISFFTFQAMSYIIDVYRGTSQALRNPFYLGLYISFFPQLIAGPIVRYNTIAEQILYRKETLRKLSVGTNRFVTGLAKKVVIANSMAIVADRTYAMAQNGSIPAMLAWVATIAYTLQIFFDFSAYSDMAIGLGLMFGFQFDENFNYPYISRSISEFWRRWHISLSTWFKDYLYFPLGGSRLRNQDKVVRNLFIVWLATGIWHGASWTFVLWGMFNFTLILFERFFDIEKSQKYRFLRHAYTLFAINMAWIFFRSPSISFAGRMISALFGTEGFYSPTAMMFIREYSVMFMLAIFFCIPIAKRTNTFLVSDRSKWVRWFFELAYPIAMIVLLAISFAYIVKGSYNPFIYFNF